MNSLRVLCLLILLGVFVAVGLEAQESAREAIPNWPAPPTWSPGQSDSGGSGMTDVTSPLPFIGITPCRIADTRGLGFTGQAGPPSLTANVRRTFQIAGTVPGVPAQCGIPEGAGAVSFNFAVTNITANGNLIAFSAAGNPATISSLNWQTGFAALSNAAVVPVSLSGGLGVQVNAAGGTTVDLIIDVNGYYASAAANQGNTFTVINDAAYNPAILGQTNSTSTNASGVKGIAAARTGITFGVWGQNFSSSELGIGVFGTEEATSGATFGVYGRSNSSDGATGVYGEAPATNIFGRLSGVSGFEAGTGPDSAGVRGVNFGGSPPTGSTFLTAGVRGEARNGWGVLGISDYVAVRGIRLNSFGGVASAGTLGDVGLGVYYENGLAGTGTKSFVEPHPTDASKVIRYVSLEGPEAGTYFRGTDQTHHGVAVIQVPESFRFVTDTEGLTVQLTPVGAPATMYVVSQDLNQIEVRSSRDVKFHYMVNGVRKAYPHWVAIQDNEKFFVPESPSDRLPSYLSEEERGRLIRNGTYNADGTVNMETAERVGWTKIWAEREAQGQAAALEARKAAAAGQR